MIFGIIDGQSLRISAEKIVSDSFNYLTAKFFFSEDWAGTVKWAHLAQADDQYDIMLDADDEIKQDKHLTLQEGCWTVYLHGNRMDGDEVTERITTEQRGIKVLESGVIDGEPIPLPPSAAEQILAYAMEAREKIANLQADAETLEPGAEATATYDYESDTMTFGIPKGEKGETGEQGPQGEPFTIEDFELSETYQAIIASEEAREAAEDERELAEESRETAEQNRVSAEAERVSAEVERVSDEFSRVSAESSRVSAESARVSDESARVTAETGRVAAEESRVTAESARVAAEEARATEFAGFASQIAAKADKTALANTDRNLKYLYELTHGQSWDLQRGTNPAYQQIVPSGAHKADVLMYGGKTVVWNQLLDNTQIDTPLQNASGTKASSYGTVSDGVCRVAIGNYGENVYIKFLNLPKVISGHKYLLGLSYDNQENSTAGVIGIRIASNLRKSVSLEAGKHRYYDILDPAESGDVLISAQLVGNSGKYRNLLFYVYDINLIDITQMFGGSEPTDLNDPRIAEIERYAALHPEYDTGSLLSANVVNIESIGFNIFENANVTNGKYLDSTGTMQSIEGTSITDYIPVIGGTTYYYSRLFSSQVSRYCVFYDAAKNVISSAMRYTDGTITAPTNAQYIRFSIATAYLDTFCFNISNTALNGSYKPFHKESINVPAAVKALPGYGWSASDAYNYVDLAEKKYHQLVGSRTYVEGDENDSTVITDGTTTYYTLAEEVITDISNLWTEQTYLGVEAGGTVTFKRSDDTQLAVPNDTEYYINLAEVTQNA